MAYRYPATNVAAPLVLKSRQGKEICTTSSVKASHCNDSSYANNMYPPSLLVQNRNDSNAKSEREQYSVRQVTMKRGRPRKYWPEYDTSQITSNFRTVSQGKRMQDEREHNSNIKLTRREEQDEEETRRLCDIDDEYSHEKGKWKWSEMTSNSRKPEIFKDALFHTALHHREGMLRGGGCSSACYESQPCFMPGQAQVSRPYTVGTSGASCTCCLSDEALTSNHKYEESCFVPPCYPNDLPEVRHYPYNTYAHFGVHHRPQTNCAMEKQLQDKSEGNPSTASPIIVECFSLAKGGTKNTRMCHNETSSTAEELRTSGNKVEPQNLDSNQDLSVTNHRNEHAHGMPGVTSLNVDCSICQQIATGCPTSLPAPNMCCYANEKHWPISRRDIDCNKTHTLGKELSAKKTEKLSFPTTTTTKQERECSKESRYNIDRNDQDYRSITEDKSIAAISKTDFGSFTDLDRKRSPDSNACQSNLVLPGQPETMLEKTQYRRSTYPLDQPANGSTRTPSAEGFVHSDSIDNAVYSPESNDSLIKRKWEEIYDIFQASDSLKLGSKSYHCSHCGRNFTHLSSLNNHIRTHTGQKPFKCRFCGKRFAQSGVLTAHLRTHTGDKPFKCVICDKRFAQTTTLANHVRTHTGQKPFSCKFCSRTFAQSSTRNKHEMSHTKAKSFGCKYCGRSFSQSATAIRHMRIHVKDTKYTCVHCDRTFAYLYSLDKHLDSHSRTG